jgi:hypothetical protein
MTHDERKAMTWMIEPAPANRPVPPVLQAAPDRLHAIKVDRGAYTATVLDFLTRALSKDPVPGPQEGR